LNEGVEEEEEDNREAREEVGEISERGSICRNRTEEAVK
jgi:hypothetical protein